MQKKLLLIMPRFFNYPNLISEELNNMGYQVMIGLAQMLLLKLQSE